MILQWTLIAPGFFILISKFVPQVKAHGRLIEPPSRASMWRYGFNTPPNYNDHELYCGGFSRQWQRNGGKCGICGDPWDSPLPRPHEAGGKYGQGVIARKYKKGAAFTIRVELTANHRGYFEFKLCPNNSPKKTATQQCFDKYVLRRAQSTGRLPNEMFHETRFYPGTENKVYEIRYMLPESLTCTQCIIQWRYVAGNNWGTCPNGTGAVGCGPQEEFRACADILIQDSSSSADDTPYDVDDEENIIPDGGDKEQINEIYPEVEENDWRFITLAIIVGALFFTILIYALLYFYFYYAGETVKRWRSFTLHESLGFKNKQDKAAQMPANSIPIPPPRAKKINIDFKGVLNT